MHYKIDWILDVRKLLARVRANLRRPRAAATDGSSGEEVDPVFRFGAVEVDRQARLVRHGGAEVHLTPPNTGC